MLKADVPRGRLALGSLLDEKRLRVHPDGRIEGLATLITNELAAPGNTQGRRDSVVAGACYARNSPLPVPLRLQVEGRVSLAV